MQLFLRIFWFCFVFCLSLLMSSSSLSCTCDCGCACELDGWGAGLRSNLPLKHFVQIHCSLTEKCRLNFHVSCSRIYGNETCAASVQRRGRPCIQQLWWEPAVLTTRIFYAILKKKKKISRHFFHPPSVFSQKEV